MKVQNLTRQTTIAKSIIHATSLKDQSLGLLQHKTPIAMLFHTRWGIHTLFMKYPIDVIVLDKENKVAKLKENLPPNQLFIWNPKYNQIIELPPGTVKITKTEITDQLVIS